MSEDKDRAVAAQLEALAALRQMGTLAESEYTATRRRVTGEGSAGTDVSPTVKSTLRWLLTGLTGVLFYFAAANAADTVQENYKANDFLAESAPQQSVVEGRTIREAATEGLKLFGLFGGLVFLNIASAAAGRNATRN